MPKVILAFDGTGLTSQEYSVIEQTIPVEDTVRIYFEGCHSSKTGGSYIFPDISGMAKKIVRSFDQSGEHLDLDKLKKDFGTAIVIEPSDSQLQGKKGSYGQITVDEVTLSGFSRGGISVFAVAKELHRAGKQIPLHLIANQPVPGNSHAGALTLVAEIMDLSGCYTIQTATVIVGSYIEKLGHTALNKLIGNFHNLFFKQAIPYFPDTVTLNVIECPIEHHFSSMGIQLGYLHTHRVLQELGYVKQDHAQKLEKYYETHYLNFEPIFLHVTEQDAKQAVFGDRSKIKIDPNYQDALDKLALVDLIYTNFWPSIGIKDLSNEQKKAIVSLRRRFNNVEDNNLLRAMVSQVLEPSPQGEKFIKIINSSTQMIALTMNYLMGKTKDAAKDKLGHLAENKNHYLKELFTVTYEYLTIPNPNEQDKNSLVENLAKNDTHLMSNEISKRQNPITDACVTLIKNLVFGILSLGGVFIYNAFKNRSIFLKKEVESRARLETGTRKVNQELLEGNHQFGLFNQTPKQKKSSQPPSPPSSKPPNKP